MYVVYTDALGEALRKLECPYPFGNGTSFAVNGRHGPIRADVDIRVVVRWWEAQQWKTAEYSLRTDVPGRDDGYPYKGPVVTTRDRHEVQPLPELEELLGRHLGPGEVNTEYEALKKVAMTSPLLLLRSAAPEPFVFKIRHPKLGQIEGFALYLPFVDGNEMSAAWNLGHKHGGYQVGGAMAGGTTGPNRCVCFWKGRLIPQTKLAALPGFLQPKNPEAGSRDWLDRVYVCLFLGKLDVPGQPDLVDTTKFKFKDDLAAVLTGSASAASHLAADDGWQRQGFRYSRPCATRWSRTTNMSKDFADW